MKRFEVTKYEANLLIQILEAAKWPIEKMRTVDLIIEDRIDRSMDGFRKDIEALSVIGTQEASEDLENLVESCGDNLVTITTEDAEFALVEKAWNEAPEMTAGRKVRKALVGIGNALERVEDVDIPQKPTEQPVEA